MMSQEKIFKEWLADRRSAKPSPDLVDRVMAAVDKTVQTKPVVHLANQLNSSLAARLAVCISAMTVGSLPLLYVAYSAKLFAF